MDILLVGFSSLAQRRLIPALVASERVGRIHVASRRAAVEVRLPEARKGTIFQNYHRALAESDARVVYVSLPNHLHAEWTRRSLEAGFHVIVDKPSALSLGAAERLLELAAAKERCLAEATVWPFHPQVSMACRAFHESGDEPKVIQATFSFPPLPAGNFRNDPAMGGGCFNDLAPYAVSAGRVFFGDVPDHVACRIVSRDDATGIDTAFTLTAEYSGGRVFQGFFSFLTEYRNQMTLLARRTSVVLEPAFTSSGRDQHEVVVRRENVRDVIRSPVSDGFREFFDRVLASVERGEWTEWYERLGDDARARARAAQDAGLEPHGN